MKQTACNATVHFNHFLKKTIQMEVIDKYAPINKNH